MSDKPAFLDDNHRYKLYSQALQNLYDRADDEAVRDQWWKRMAAFRDNRTSKRTVWINFVEANAGKIEWCEQLVLEVVTIGLGIELKD